MCIRDRTTRRSLLGTRYSLLSSMSILITPETKILIQGITGAFGARHAQLSLDYGTQVVAGVTPGKGGQFFEHKDHKVPIFNSVAPVAAAASACLLYTSPSPRDRTRSRMPS